MGQRVGTTAAVAELAPLGGGAGVSLAASRDAGPQLAAAGYVESEHTASGTAVAYAPAPPGELPADGHYDLVPGAAADYVTRIVVRRPAPGAGFNGTVVVEWLNVSGGLDAAPDYTYLADELLRGGYAWVGVSAQRVGIEGGSVAVGVPDGEAAGAGRGLKALDPERYGGLAHPGDAFAYDIYTQVGRALRQGSDQVAADGPLAGLAVERVLAVGESQSAFALTTYVNGVQPLAGVYDGFLIHSRGGAGAPLGEPGTGLDIVSTITGPTTKIRTDGAAPVIVVETETDVLGVLGYLPARQDDADRFRLWEIAGTAHADKFQLGETEASLGCAQPVNRGQQVYVLRAALRHLDTWVRDGRPAPRAARLEVDEPGQSGPSGSSGPHPAFVLDDVGNVRGGVRTPAVDVPVDVLSGMPAPGSSLVCILMGTTAPLPAERLAALHPSREAYLAAYEKAADAMVDAGFALADDRAQLLADASPDRIGAR
jgi:hypothetical protein